MSVVPTSYWVPGFSGKLRSFVCSAVYVMSVIFSPPGVGPAVPSIAFLFARVSTAVLPPPSSPAFKMGRVIKNMESNVRN